MKASSQHVDQTYLHLVASPQKSHTLLALWHLLSFDAPTVASVWTVFIAHSVGMYLPWTASLAMFLAVWMLYAADRLLDARMSAPEQIEHRHHFHHNHHAAFVAGIIVCTFGLAWLMPTFFPPALRLYALLGVLLGTYFFLIHLGRPGAKRLPKELAVGLFFPAAIFIPTVARLPALRLHLLPAALLFAAVCTLNCLYVYAWEHSPPFRQAHWTTRIAAERLTPLTLSVAAASAALALWSGSSVACATGMSALLLLWLNSSRGRLSALHLRAAADLALLTPLLLPALWR